MKRRNSNLPKCITSILTLLFICSLAFSTYAQNGVIVPAYIYPKVKDENGKIKDSHDWNILYNMANKFKERLIVVVNPDNGPGKGTKADPNYTNAIKKIRDAGSIVIGYVHVCYALNKQTGTCAGRTENDVRKDINNWKSWYNIDGIFLDEATSNPHRDSIDWMLGVNDYVGKRFGWDYNVNNFGTVPPRGYWASHGVIHSQIQIVMENSVKFYDDHKKNIPVVEYKAGLILHTGKHTDPARIKPEAKAKNINWIYITNDIMDNPYDKLPYFLEGLF